MRKTFRQSNARYPTTKVSAFFRRRYDLSSYILNGASDRLLTNGLSSGRVAFLSCLMTVSGGF